MTVTVTTTTTWCLAVSGDVAKDSSRTLIEAGADSKTRAKLHWEYSVPLPSSAVVQFVMVLRLQQVVVVVVVEEELAMRRTTQTMT